MEYRPRSGPCYGPNVYGGAHGNGAYGGGHGHGGYGNGTYAGGHGVYGYGGGGDGRYLPYGRGAVPGYCVGQPLAAASHGQYGHGRGWGADEHLGGVWAPPPPVILPEAMRPAEAAAGEVLLRLHPTEAAERRRHEVIDYARRLIGTTFGCEVYEFGSVPLKTYLPDGDVDITVLTNTPLDSTFIEDVRHFLESEANNEDSQFVIKDVKVINAKVKLIKCVIDNVVVDITFDQVGGVSKLCFLELVDNEIGKDHLFKRTIILIKAWCYHERNIHGSNQWLLSTYALEILVLYIFNLFHKSLHGPLEALYKFFEYYSNFDWDKQCLTINGPMPVSSRRNFTEPAALNGELLLSKESLKSSLDRLIVLPIGSERLDAEFCPKYINIIDPLKGDNNLGRSISEYNLPRIKDAFKYGAQKLGQILKLPSELIPEGIYGFFATTLSRNGKGDRQDLGDIVSFQYMPDSGHGQGEHLSSLEKSYGDKNENRSPNSLLELTDKELSSGLTNFSSHSPSSSESGNDIIKQCHNDSATNADVPVARSNRTDVSQENLQLPPFTLSNLLDLSGDVGLPLKCLRSVQYNLEALFYELIESATEASLAGVLDENCFNSPTLAFLSETDGRKLSTFKCSQGTGDVPQQSITEAQSFSGTHIPSSGLSLYPPADVYHNPWFQNTEDTPQTYGAGMYMPDMNFSMPPRTDTLPIGSTFYPALSVDKGNYPFSSPYLTGDSRKTRGTGTYIPKRAWYDKKQNQRQPDQVNIEKRPDRVNSCNGYAAAERALKNGEIKQVPTSESTEKGEQRYVNGLMETPTLPPPTIAFPHHGGGSQGDLPEPSTGQPSPPAVTIVTPAVKMVNGKSITSQQHENLQFGTVGPFSATSLKPKFIEDFPPLAGTKKPVQAAPPLAVKSPKAGTSGTKSWPVEATGSTVQSPRAGVSVTQSRPVEAQASTAQSPGPSESAAECRPEKSYQLKDDADFPPLQAGTRYNADFPPLRAASR